MDLTMQTTKIFHFSMAYTVQNLYAFLLFFHIPCVDHITSTVGSILSIQICEWSFPNI